MKKIIIFFLMILSITIFSEEYRPYLKKNITNKNLVFSAQIKDSKKVISIYKENKKLVYVYGLEGEKAEKIIVGNANKNLFKNENEIPLNEYNNYGVKENSYSLTVARNDEEILFDKELDISTVYDNLFNTNFFKKLPYDNGVVAYYITYD